MAVVPLEKTGKGKIYNYKDYEKLPEGSPYQLIGGELVMTPSPVPYHQIISMRIEYELLKFVEERKLGIILYAPIDVYLSEEDIYQPDIIFISNDRLNIIGEKKIESAPDLIVEILSPATAYYDLKHKKRIYESSGVKEFWIIDPMEKSIEVYENVGGRFKLFNEVIKKGKIHSNLIKGLEVEVETVFKLA
ncbi:MAG: Uma2 family endonuclease [Candidatus Brocadiaceae bacterium]|nr:Uma2 family endonuclease [Candidatus Brocadiaceae bacterium]